MQGPAGDLRRNYHPLQRMPRRPILSGDDGRLAKKTFLELHIPPMTWADARDAFTTKLASRLNYSRESTVWPSLEHNLHRSFSNIHRQAVRVNWIDKVPDGWRLTDLGVSFLRGGPIRLAAANSRDAHDSDLRDLLKELDAAVQSNIALPVVAGLPSLQVTGLDDRARRRPLFRDLGWHVTVLGIPSSRSPGVLFDEMIQLSRASAGRRRRGIARCKTTLKRANPSWDGRHPNISTAPLVAMDLLLSETVGRRTAARSPLLKPVVWDGEIRVSGLTLFVGDAAANLPRIRKAWSRAIREAKRSAIRFYKESWRLWRDFEEARAKCRQSIETVQAYPVYPGICKFRRTSREPKSAK